MNTIKKGSVVDFNGGYYRVKSLFTKTANLCGIFTSDIKYKKVNINELRECHDEWYAEWSKSETYMCM